LLAVETATSTLSVAMLRGGELLDEILAPPGPAATTLLPAIAALSDRTGVSIDAVEGFAVSIGPGSFTSLRVGIATVKGLAFGTDRQVAPVPTLAALSLVPPETGATIVPMLDARRGEVYAAAHGGEGSSQPVVAAGVYTPDELCERLPLPCVLVGEAVALFGDAMIARLGDGASLLPAPAGDARARHVGTLGAAMLAKGEGVDAALLTPNYLRRAEAEVKRTGSRFESPPLGS
jgi:tRNA threonylcarbamoyladenosine biosynthesis protein TsaB